MTKKASTAAWISQETSAEPLRAKSLLMTLFGDAIAPHGGTIWLGSLIELMAPFGVSDRLVRTSVFRLTEEGWLASSRNGRRSAYSITDDALKRFGKAYRRVYAPLEPVWDGYWVLLFATHADIAPAKRALFRKQLAWEGFGMISPGVHAHPTPDEDAVHGLLDRFGLQEQLFVIRARDLPDSGGKPLRAAVGEAWALDDVLSGYLHFIERFAPLAEMVDKGSVSPEQAFVIRTLLIHAFRRVQLHDPKLPSSLLPDDWPGNDSYTLCRDIYRKVYDAAEVWLLAVLRREDENVVDAAPYFYERFGGLRQG
jgi:phenylacetic acid degradation operon negative regulatory protein